MPFPLQVVSPRSSPARDPERMDDPACDPAQLERALDALSLANRWFGGRRAVRRPIERALSRRQPGELSLLDVGTGSGDIPRHLERRLRGRGWRARFCLADSHWTTLRLARARTPGHTCVRCAAPDLPFADASFDLAVAATMLHHLETRAARKLLCELDRVSRVGWVVTDLRRGRLATVAIELLGRSVWWRNPVAREDGRVSVRRAFTPREIRALVAEARLEDEARLRDVRVRSAGPFRWVCLGGELARP